MDKKISPEHIVRQFEVRPGIYVLGSVEARVNILAQQQRALNLVFALESTHRLRAGNRIAVVGAGVSGLTVAAAAATRNFASCVFEQHDRSLFLLRSSPRYVHPHLFDWPKPGWNQPRANLPLLDWSAGAASEVASQIETGWNEVCRRADLAPELRYKALDVQVVSEVPGVNLVQWYSQGLMDEKFEVVVLCIGFGSEVVIQGIDSASYWHPKPAYEPGVHSKLAVIGCGDGGVTDLLKMAISNFDWEHDVSMLSLPSVERIVPQILEIEEHSVAQLDTEFSTWLWHQYRAIEVPELDALIKSRVRTMPTTLIAPTLFPFRRDAFILNRFLLSRLLKIGAVRYRVGRITSAISRANHIELMSDGKAQGKFDNAIVRIGAKSALREFDERIWEQATVLNAAKLDQTRQQIWRKSYYSGGRKSMDTISVARPSHSRNNLKEAYWEIVDRLQESKAEVDVTALTANSLDRIYQVDDYASSYFATRSRPKDFPGGSGANTAYALARLGLKTAVAGAVATDSAGRLLSRSLRDAGVNIDFLTEVRASVGSRTGETLSFLKGLRRSIYVSPGINEKWATLVASSNSTLALQMQVRQSRILHVTSFTGNAERHLQNSLLQSATGIVSFFPGSIYCSLGLEEIVEFIGRANVVFLYEAHLDTLLKRTPITRNRMPGSLSERVDALFRWRRKQGFGEPLLVAVRSQRIGKKTEQYLALGYGREKLDVFIPGQARMHRSDRSGEQTGIGDAMAAGVLFGLLRGVGPYGCADIAIEMSRIATEQRGARASLPTMEQLIKRVGVSSIQGETPNPSSE